MSDTLERMQHIQHRIQSSREELKGVVNKFRWNKEDYIKEQNELIRQHAVLQQKLYDDAQSLSELYTQWHSEAPDCSEIVSSLGQDQDQASVEDLPELEPEVMPQFLDPEKLTSSPASE